MRDVLGPGTILGYCTNVHAGRTLDEIKHQLQTHAVEVKKLVAPHEPMGVGLWFPASAVQELVGDRSLLLDFRDWLADRNLVPYTINGFPYGDFHEEVVKHKVYSPDWADALRLNYTVSLARILSTFIQGGREGSISTLPIGWYQPFLEFEEQEHAAALLRTLVDRLARLESETGCLIHVNLEPEPCCAIECAGDVVDFFKRHLFGSCNDDAIRRHLRVCHDVCHAAVMFDDQERMFDDYRALGLQIGKVQISNAIRLDLRDSSPQERKDAIAELEHFSEDRYLHQTMIRCGSSMGLQDDLPNALKRYASDGDSGDEWRIHFHVPIYLEQFGLLKTTRDHIIECFKLLKGSEVKHWEVETYAWNVLPPPLQVPELSAGIARELQWVRDTAASLNLDASSQ